MVDTNYNPHSLKGKITLIIPSRNRHPYLNRIIDYYRDSDFLSIVICDSSPHPYEQVKLLPPHIAYLHYPGHGFIEKLDKCLSALHSPFLLLCADDDFITIEGISKGLDFLEMNPDYGSVQGNSISFYFDRKKVFYAPLYEGISGLDIGSAVPRERVKALFNNNIQLFYSIHRAHVLRDIFKRASGKIKSLNLLESFIGTEALIEGKHKVLPVFYGVREILYDSAGRLVGINILSTDSKYSPEYEAFIAEMADLLAQKEGSDKAEAAFFLKSIIDSAVAIKYNQHFLRQQSQLKWIKKWIPFFVRKYLRYLRLVKNEQEQERRNIAYAGFPFNNSSGREELRKIEEVIRKHTLA